MDDQIIYTSPEGEHIGLSRAEFAGSRFEALGYTELSDEIAPEEAPEAEADLGGDEPTESAHDQGESSGSTEAANPPMEPMPNEAADPAPSEPNADGSSGPGGNASADPANA